MRHHVRGIIVVGGNDTPYGFLIALRLRRSKEIAEEHYPLLEIIVSIRNVRKGNILHLPEILGVIHREELALANAQGHFQGLLAGSFGLFPFSAVVFATHQLIAIARSLKVLILPVGEGEAAIPQW